MSKYRLGDDRTIERIRLRGQPPENHVFKQSEKDDFICSQCGRARVHHLDDGFRPTTMKTISDLMAEEQARFKTI